MASKPDSDWIEWAGGECPLPADTCIHFRTRLERDWSISDDLIKEGADRSADSVRWEHSGAHDDIIAYRVVVSA